MKVERRRFAQSLTAVLGGVATSSTAATVAAPRTASPFARAQARLPAATVTKIRVFYPPTHTPNRRLDGSLTHW